MTPEERNAAIRAWWPDRTIRRTEMAKRLMISDTLLTQLARELSLPDRRAHEFRENLRVRIRGVDYEDAPAAAAALGVTAQTVYSAIWEGREDYVGLGRCRKQNRPSPRMQKVVEIGPFRWASHNEAAKALGVARSTISSQIREGRIHHLMALAMQYQAKIEKRKAA